MKFIGFKVMRRVINKMKNPKVYSIDDFSDEYVDVPKNNLNYGELKLVFDKHAKQKVENKQKSCGTNLTEKKQKMDKETFITNSIKWGEELLMSDE